MLSLFANCSTANIRKEKERKNRMKTHRSMSRVREKEGLLRLLSGLAFLFFWSIEASKHCCWRQNKRCDFRTFFRFSDFILRLASNKNLHRRIRWVKKKMLWLVWNCLRKPLFVIPFFRDDSLPRARSRLSQICFLSLPTRRRSGGGPMTN